ncbi:MULTISPECIES: DUF1801 domain-containing protein [unclassified Enterococcus]|uniref:iron chaperone n=1 Tax=unclassified Enterococcus TaxID=2608891 RepID=UPI0015568697|nr:MULTISPECIES: DUF1801 domain-containing protein [unclassified Enterococcus]MBS7576457.1 DUF1801 domain-containing protein [Enterococcus sp. MMGLQ5-2]MBS7583689.1 DUF1801 domain-containing protein [Enterococcus sp. MMGLQ5-1]NPD11550.1 hypothetical protein [Enterococcus sp. MMGLQ5-1]NPD36294.1 hypothetical protein [Enterococcus sp. MMGLQ5-2]
MTVIEQYIAEAAENQQPHLKACYQVIKMRLPKATEQIKYGLPTFYQNGSIVHFGAMKNHLGFYPTPEVINYFSKALKSYQTSKGAVRFSYQEALPLDLIEGMIDYRKSILNIA